MKRRSTYVRTIPRWYANPIVIIPGLTALSVLASAGAVLYAWVVLR